MADLGDSLGWIQTRSGRVFDFSTGAKNIIDPIDIAWALAHIPRFNGHAFRFYSVAEHCVHMAAMPNHLGLTLMDENFHALIGRILIHDAHEAYIGDLSRPMKGIIGPAWYELEDRIAYQVRCALGIASSDDSLWELCKRCDNVMLAAEASQLMTAPQIPCELGDSERDAIGFTIPVNHDRKPEYWAQEWLSRYLKWKSVV